jgi:hypothetical protein
MMAKRGWSWVLAIALTTVTPAMAQTPPKCFTVYPFVPPADCFNRVAPPITPPVVQRPTPSAPPVAVAPAQDARARWCQMVEHNADECFRTQDRIRADHVRGLRANGADEYTVKMYLRSVSSPGLCEELRASAWEGGC